MSGLFEILRSQPFNLELFLLVIFLGIWIASSIGQTKWWPGVKIFLGELMVGYVCGIIMGYVLISHNLVGILTVGSITIGIVLVLNAPRERKIARLLSVGFAFITAMSIYLENGGDLGYFIQTIIEDFTR